MVDLVGDYLDFLCICVIVIEFELVMLFVECVQLKGLEVLIQLVKLYFFEFDVFVVVGKWVCDVGVWIVYVVDMMGIFLFEDVCCYVEVFCGVSDVFVGFYGYNNFVMVVVNILEVFDVGVDFLDGMLMGFGCGVGNCQIECFVVVLQWCGYLVVVDLDWIFDVV